MSGMLYRKIQQQFVPVLPNWSVTRYQLLYLVSATKEQESDHKMNNIELPPIKHDDK